MLPRYLAGPDPAQLPRISARVAVVGSGIAGLFTAMRLAETGPVTVLTKHRLADSNTELAQGGIAAAIGDTDSPELHFQDTLAAGDGLCDPAAVGALVREGPARVLELAALGVQFDRNQEGFALTREGAHSRRRILHAHGDATGDEIRRGLEEQVRRHPRIRLLEDHFAVDLVTEPWHEEAGTGRNALLPWTVWAHPPTPPRRRVVGVTVLRPDGGLVLIETPFVVLATGGAGRLYRTSTNPEVATGDGVAIAFRAGAAVADVEFVQFHPTALAAEDIPRSADGSPRFLISEAVRGEGALLLTTRGQRFMPDYDSRGELAPRDIVARAIAREMERTASGYVWLDTRPIGEGFPQRFPTIFAACQERGLDPRREPIPVAPAAHYAMGGVLTDTQGRTTLPGLFACGETACTGLHGANRLASNSLVEGLVFGRRIADFIRGVEAGGPPQASNGQRELAASEPEGGHLPHRWLRPSWPQTDRSAHQPALGPTDPARLLAEAQDLMWRRAGIVRNQEGLEQAWAEMAGLAGSAAEWGPGAAREALELANLSLVGALVARAALERRESRGAHFREDHPRRDDEHWRHHIVQQREEDDR